MKFLYIITFSNEKNELFLHFNIEGLSLWEPFKVKWDPALQIWSLMGKEQMQLELIRARSKHQ